MLPSHKIQWAIFINENIELSMKLTKPRTNFCINAVHIISVKKTKNCWVSFQAWQNLRSSDRLSDVVGILGGTVPVFQTE